MVTHEEVENIRSTLARADYPVGRADLLEAVGDEQVHVEGVRFAVRELLERVPDNQFRSLDHLMEQLRANVPSLHGAPHAAPRPDALRDELSRVQFPATRADVIEKIGDRVLNVGGREVRMREMLERVPEERYPSRDDLATRLASAMPDLEGGR